VRRDYSGEKLGIGWDGRLELEALWRREQSAPERRRQLKSPSGAPRVEEALKRMGRGKEEQSELLVTDHRRARVMARPAV